MYVGVYVWDASALSPPHHACKRARTLAGHDDDDIADRVLDGTSLGQPHDELHHRLVGLRVHVELDCQARLVHNLAARHEHRLDGGAPALARVYDRLLGRDEDPEVVVRQVAYLFPVRARRPLRTGAMKSDAKVVRTPCSV